MPAHRPEQRSATPTNGTCGRKRPLAAIGAVMHGPDSPVALTATSSGITARVLKDLGPSRTPEARIILGAAVIDDDLERLAATTVSAARRFLPAAPASRRR